MLEIWKDIKGYEGLYQVSNLGRIKSLERTIEVKTKHSTCRTIKERILKPEKCKSTQYLYVNLNKFGNVKHCTVHRLVAEAFIPNPDNLPQINHLDENRSNNCADNLEWCTNKHNCNYGKHNYNMSKIKKIQNKGINNPFYCKHHSDEVKQKISKRFKHSIRITNGIINKTITPDEFESYKLNGWKRGMIKHYDK